MGLSLQLDRGGHTDVGHRCWTEPRTLTSDWTRGGIRTSTDCTHITSSDIECHTAHRTRAGSTIRSKTSTGGARTRTPWSTSRGTSARRQQSVDDLPAKWEEIKAAGEAARRIERELPRHVDTLVDENKKLRRELKDAKEKLAESQEDHVQLQACASPPLSSAQEWFLAC